MAKISRIYEDVLIKHLSKYHQMVFLVEVTTNNNHGTTRALHYFFEKTGAEHAFQVGIDDPYVDADCFAQRKPIRVPAKTLLSQLV